MEKHCRLIKIPHFGYFEPSTNKRDIINSYEAIQLSKTELVYVIGVGQLKTDLQWEI